MKIPRSSGVLLHPTSLPSRWGIGDLGPSARSFVDFLETARQRWWQVLPVGPTGYGDSPYQSFSAFAGNPLLVSIDDLVAEGLVTEAEVADYPTLPTAEVDYGAVVTHKLGVLQKAAEQFDARATEQAKQDFATFAEEHGSWLGDFALYVALKEHHGGDSWTKWDAGIRSRTADALAHWREKLAAVVRARSLWQFFFYRQWRSLRHYAGEHGVLLMGDIPIFVSHDSADVWQHPGLFQLREDGSCAVVAGVPPDYFSATGQLWGNPLYRWEEMRKDGYAWWIARFRATFALVDLVRLDHFRGFDAYWEVPGDALNAIDGRWVNAPGGEMFEAVKAALGELPIVAENLGVITPEVEVLRERFGFPGMAILQFAFGGDSQANDFIPHNYPRHRVVYTGTHDNDTTVGWWTEGAGDTTRSAEEVERERDFVRRYLNVDGHDIHWDCVRAVLASVADLAIVPLQDLLGLGREARMNLPGRATGNWKWRYAESQLTDALQERLADMTVLYGRAPLVKPAPEPATV